MLCNRCQNNEATVIIAGNLNGTDTTLHLCADCASAINEQLLQVFPGHSVEALFAHLNSSQDQSNGVSIDGEDAFEETCPSCGYVLRNTHSPQLLGCAECYRAFADRLGPLIERLHRGVTHAHTQDDLAPPPSVDDAEREKNRRELTEQLRHAIENEEYEQAAMLRDAIRNMDGIE